MYEVMTFVKTEYAKDDLGFATQRFRLIQIMTQKCRCRLGVPVGVFRITTIHTHIGFKLELRLYDPCRRCCHLCLTGTSIQQLSYQEPAVYCPGNARVRTPVRRGVHAHV